jgi:hypothetical protein
VTDGNVKIDRKKLDILKTKPILPTYFLHEESKKNSIQEKIRVFKLSSMAHHRIQQQQQQRPQPRQRQSKFAIVAQKS